MTRQRGGLGRGLSALIPGAEEGGLLEIPVGAIVPNPRQPRERFDESALEGLAASIRDVGVLQPIAVRRLDDGGYELVAGERRLRAAKMAGLATIPAVVRETDDADQLREALIENIQRENLNPLETAAAFQELLDDLQVSQEALAAKLGFSRAHIANTIRLLQLPSDVQRLVAEGKLQAGHARALLGLDDDEARTALALRAVAEELSVRNVEDLVRAYAAGGPEPAGRESQAPARDPRVAEVEEILADELGTKVRVQMGKRRGRIVVEFGSPDDLDRIATRIVGGA
ncbi:MAG TPA: ParB/RepB/Spo0J family partition protein [Actinomycetota bacterium]|nr:ParB/RepB/Spo0J family partition protein [Actinomycetota bacterium]